MNAYKFKYNINLFITSLSIFSLFLLPSHQPTNDCKTQSRAININSIDFQDPKPPSQLTQKNIEFSTLPKAHLTTQQLHQNQRILTNLRSFQHLTENYIQQLKSMNSTPAPALLMTSFLRSGRKRYTGNAWKALAGSEEEFYSYVKKVSGNECAYYLRNVEYFYDPVTGEKIDFIHMMASLNVYMKNEFAYSLYRQIGDIGGWAGDCIQLAREGRKEKVKDKDLEGFFSDRIGVKGEFGGGDVLADIDALNLFALLEDDADISATFTLYYSSLGEGSRYQQFLQNRFKAVTSEKGLKDEIRKVISKKSFLMSMVLDREGLDLKNDKRYLEEAGDCFASYVWERLPKNARKDQGR